MSYLDIPLVGACEDHLAALPDNSIDSCVCDPPYGLSAQPDMVELLDAWLKGEPYFFGKRGFMEVDWDNYVPGPGIWSQVLRVLKPGGYALVFAGSRTQDLMGLGLRLAGFEILDTLMWVYGCLSEDTEVLVDGEWVPYHKAKRGSLAMCYDPAHDTFSWREIEHVFVYDYEDTAYRLRGDRTDQLVSRNHRCLVEQGGETVFRVAERLASWEQEVRVPVLEDVSSLCRNLPLPHQRTGEAQKDMRQDMQCHGNQPVEAWKDTTQGAAQDDKNHVPRLREEGLEARRMDQESSDALMLTALQREDARQGVGKTRVQGSGRMDREESCVVSQEDERGKQPGLEGRRDDTVWQGKLSRTSVCALPGEIQGYGPQGRVCHGASSDRGPSSWAVSGEGRSRSSRQPRPPRQPGGEPDAVQVEQGSQTVRASRFTTTDLVRIEPVEYHGKVWCLKVPTGAFVCRRNGKVFVTGNSGFPKNPDTQLKPANEPILLCQKPFEGSAAACFAEHGTAHLRIADSMVGKRHPANVIVECLCPNGPTGGKEGREFTKKNTGHNAVYNDTGQVERTSTGWAGEVAPEHEPGCPAKIIDDQSNDGAARFFKQIYSAKARQDRRWAWCKTCQVAFPVKGKAHKDHEIVRHPTQKPLGLMDYLVGLVTQPGGTVLDPFAGTFTTAVAARARGNHFVACELSPEHVKIGEARLAAAQVKDTSSLESGGILCPRCKEGGKLKIIPEKLLARACSRGKKVTCAQCLGRFDPQKLREGGDT